MFSQLSKMATNRWMVHTYSVDILDEGLVHTPDRPELGGTTTHHTIENKIELKSYEVFFYWFFFM